MRSDYPTLRKEREGWSGYRGTNRCFTRGSRNGTPVDGWSGESPKARSFQLSLAAGKSFAQKRNFAAI